MPIVGAPDALRYLHLRGVGSSAFIEPCNIVLPDRFDHQSVAFPMSDRISQPCVLDLGIMPPAVEENLPPNMRSTLIHDHDQLGVLDDRPGIRRRTHPRDTR